MRAAANDTLPLTHSQMAMWLQWKYAPDDPAYNNPLLFSLDGDLDVERLKNAFAAVIDRHEAIRMRFIEEEGVPLQQRSPRCADPLEYVDANTDANEAESEKQSKQVDDAIRACLLAPFDLLNEPVYRFLLVRIEPSRFLLALNIHHICVDGASARILLDDISAAYRDDASYRAQQHASATPGFTDYLTWETQRWADGVHKQTEAAWRAHLAGGTCSVDFGKLVSGSALQTGSARQYRWTLPASLQVALKNLNRQTRTTPFIVLAAAFSVLLHRYLQQDAVSIAYPVDIRPPAFAGLFGTFINFVPVFADVTPALRVTELFDALRAQRRQTKAIADFPQVDLMRLARQTLATPASPCLNVALIPARFELDSLRLADIDVTQKTAFVASPKQDLALLYDGDDTLSLILEYRTGLLNDSLAEDMARDFSQILQSMIERPDASIRDIVLTAESAYHDRYTTVADDRPEVSARALIEAALRTGPGRQAAGERSETVTNAALMAASDRVADLLRSVHVRVGDRVGVALDRGNALLAALLGIWKAGAVYVPLPTDLPIARRAYIAEDADLAACIHQSLPPAASTTDLVLSQAIFSEADREPVQPAPVDLDSAAYLIYTSGSTGRPKGVEVTHRNLASFLLAMQRALPLRASDRMLATTTIGFDISLLEWLLPLTTGATVIACPDAVRIDAKALQTLIDAERISWLQGTPSFFRVLRAGGWQGDARLNIVCGGEPLDASTRTFLRETCASVRHVYGPTESTIWSTISVPDNDAEADLGVPLGNTAIYLLDAYGQIAPRFSKAEIYIGGHGVARGYRNRQALTDERFVHFVRFGDAGRLYRTGDFAFRDAGDRLHFLGREDDQVKIRGFRVELGEIEKQIETLDYVRKAIVQVETSAANEAILMAWVQTVPDYVGHESELRNVLSTILPAYMVPARVAWIDHWPLNANGKIDRGALISDVVAEAQNTPVPMSSDPWIPAFQAIYGDVLGVHAIDPHASLTDLGGQSLAAVRILAQLRQKLAIDLTLEAFMTHSSVAELTGYVRALGLDRSVTDERKPVPDPLPVGAPATSKPSASERALYFLDSVSTCKETYNIPVALHFPEGVDVDLLERALRWTMEAHDALRVSFEPTAQGLVKHVHPTPSGPLIQRNAPTRLATLRPALNALLLEPFQLDRAPLVRVQHFPLIDDGAAVLYLFHHIVVDGIGCGNFLRELAAAYEAMLAGAEPDMLSDAPQAGIDNTTNNTTDSAADLTRRADELVSRFGIVDRVLNLPYCAPFPEVRTLAGDSLLLVIPADERSALEDHSRRDGVPMAAIFLSAYFLTLHQFSRDNVINVGLATMNRTPETLKKIGLYTNTIVLPVEIDPAARLGDFINRVTASLFSVYAYADVPFEEVANRSVEFATLGRTPVFQTFYNFIDRSMYAFSMAGLPVLEIPTRPTGAKFELSLEVNDFRTHTHVFFEFSKDVFDAELVEEIASEFKRILFECIRSSNETVEQLASTTHL